MWQRIQTVYMVLGALMLFTVGLGNPNVLETVLGGFGVGLFLANCTYYKNRKRQFVLNRLAMLVAFALEAVYLYPVLESGDSGVLDQSVWVTLAPLSAVVFTSLANRAIQRDENLVKSSDRIR
jgi:hypothetical protein